MHFLNNIRSIRHGYLDYIICVNVLKKLWIKKNVDAGDKSFTFIFQYVNFSVFFIMLIFLYK